MTSETTDQVYCIAHPPTPLIVGDQVRSFFPLLKLFAKCDEFIPGDRQPLSEPQQ